MTTIVKLQKKGQLTIPNRMREQIGLAEGDYIHVELSSRGSKIILQPAQVRPQTASEQLTPAQKRRLDVLVKAGIADVKAGRVHGPFPTAEAAVDFLHSEAKKARGSQRAKSSQR